MRDREVGKLWAKANDEMKAIIRKLVSERRDKILCKKYQFNTFFLSDEIEQAERQAVEEFTISPESWEP